MRAGTLVLLLALPIAVRGQSFTIDTIAGNGNVGDGGPATSALLLGAQGVAIDRLGNVYIADADDHRVRKVAPSGFITTLAGTGVAGFSGDGGPADQAQLNTPYGVAADRAGNVYIADFYNSRVRKVGTDGKISTVAGGGNRAPGPDSDGSPATSVALRAPRNIVVDSDGNLFFSDFEGHRVFKVGSYGNLTAVAGTGVAGVNGDGGPADRAELSYPAGLAVGASGTLFIADSSNHRVRRVMSGVIGSLGGLAGPLTFGSPLGLATDVAGNLYVADPVFGVIYKITAGGAVSQISSDARDVASDPAGTLYTASVSLIRKLATDGGSSRYAGAAQIENFGDGGQATAAQFLRPSAVAFDSAGNLLVADQTGNRLRSITPAGVVSTVAAGLNSPQGVATDTYGNLFLSEAGSRAVRRLNGGVWSVVANKTDLTYPGPLATDEYGNVYVSDIDGNRVLRIAPSGRVEPFAGTGQRGYQGDNGLASLALLNAPRGLAVDRLGNLYIADSGNHRIRKVTPDGMISSVASGLSFPYSVAVSTAGAVAVSEAGSHSIRIVAGAAANPVAGTGKPGFGGDGGSAATAQFNLPSAIVFDPAGNLYVADSFNRRIRKLTVQTVVAPPPLVSASVTNAASYVAQAIAPGEIISIFGSGLGPATAAGAVLGSTGVLETQIAETTVTFDGVAAPLLHVSDSQINLVVPYTVAGKASTEIEVRYRGTAKAHWSAAVAEAAPGLFAVSNGTGQVIAVHTDSSLNSRTNPAARGTIVTLYATGEGLRTPAAVDGKPADVLAKPKLPVSLKIAGYDAEVQYAGAAPGFVGLMQINVRVPSGFAPTGEQPVTLKAGSFESQSGVTLWIR